MEKINRIKNSLLSISIAHNGNQEPFVLATSSSGKLFVLKDEETSEIQVSNKPLFSICSYFSGEIIYSFCGASEEVVLFTDLLQETREKLTINTGSLANSICMVDSHSKAIFGLQDGSIKLYDFEKSNLEVMKKPRKGEIEMVKESFEDRNLLYFVAKGMPLQAMDMRTNPKESNNVTDIKCQSFDMYSDGNWALILAKNKLVCWSMRMNRASKTIKLAENPGYRCCINENEASCLIYPNKILRWNAETFESLPSIVSSNQIIYDYQVDTTNKITHSDYYCALNHGSIEYFDSLNLNYSKFECVY